MATTVELLGGEAAVDGAVDAFYPKVPVDDRILRFFDTTDMEAQALKHKAFLTMVFDGPSNYSGKGMREGHAHLGEIERVYRIPSVSTHTRRY